MNRFSSLHSHSQEEEEINQIQKHSIRTLTLKTKKNRNSEDVDFNASWCFEAKQQQYQTMVNVQRIHTNTYLYMETHIQEKKHTTKDPSKGNRRKSDRRREKRNSFVYKCIWTKRTQHDLRFCVGCTAHTHTYTITFGRAQNPPVIRNQDDVTCFVIISNWNVWQSVSLEMRTHCVYFFPRC